MRSARILFAALACALLSGCVSPVEDYAPDVIDITDPAKLAADEIFCRAHALAYKPPFNLQSIGLAAGQGASQNATAAAVSPATAPLVLGAGAAGGASGQLLSLVGLRGPEQIKIFVRCLEARGRKSGAYTVTDPNL